MVTVTVTSRQLRAWRKKVTGLISSSKDLIGYINFIIPDDPMMREFKSIYITIMKVCIRRMKEVYKWTNIRDIAFEMNKISDFYYKFKKFYQDFIVNYEYTMAIDS